MSFFFFNDTATTEIYTLSLHDALPIWCGGERGDVVRAAHAAGERDDGGLVAQVHRLRPGAGAFRHLRCLDRKSTRLNSSHANISYAVFCLKKKTKHNTQISIKESVDVS